MQEGREFRATAVPGFGAMHVINILQLLLDMFILWKWYWAFSTEKQYSFEYDKQWEKLSSIYIQKNTLALPAVC